MEFAATKEGCLAFVPTIWLSKVELVQVVVILLATCWTGYSTKIFYDSSQNTYLVCGSENVSVTRQCWKSYQEDIGSYSLPYWVVIVLQCFAYAVPWMIFWIFYKSQAKHLSETVSSLYPNNLEEIRSTSPLVSDYRNTGFFRWYNIQTALRILLLVAIIIIHAVFFNTGTISCRFEGKSLSCVVPNWRAPFIGMYVANGLLLLLLFVEVWLRFRFWKWICDDKSSRQKYQDLLWFAYGCEKRNCQETWRKLAVFRCPSSPNFKICSATKGNSVYLEWSRPNDVGEAGVSEYNVQWQLRGENSWATKDVPAINTTINDLIDGSYYLFRVRAKAQRGYGEWSDVMEEKTADQEVSVATNDYSLLLLGSNSPVVLEIPGTLCVRIIEGRHCAYILRHFGEQIDKKFEVQWKKLTDDYWQTTDSSLYTDFIIAGLQLGATYSFRARVEFTPGSYGKWSNNRELVILERQPRPPEQLQEQRLAPRQRSWEVQPQAPRQCSWEVQPQAPRQLLREHTQLEQHNRRNRECCTIL